MGCKSFYLIKCTSTLSMKLSGYYRILQRILQKILGSCAGSNRPLQDPVGSYRILCRILKNPRPVGSFEDF